MIVLHALWSHDAELCVWGERSAMPARSHRPPGRPSQTPRSPTHPFCCPPPLLRETLARVGVETAIGQVRGRRMALQLPASDHGPQSSPQLLRVIDDSEPPGSLRGLGVWEIDALALPAIAAVDLVPALSSSAPVGVVFGDSVRYLVEVSKLALELVARGRLRPGLERSGEGWLARWRPALDDGLDAERIGVLARAMPPMLRAELSHAEQGTPPRPLLDGFLAAMIDACARAFLQGRLRADGEPDPDPAGPVEAWLLALVGEDPAVAGDPWELGALSEQVEEWWSAGRRYGAQRMFRTCFRLVPPGEDAPGDVDLAGEPDGDDQPWRVEIMLQHKEDASVLVPAADVWAHSERLSALGRLLENPQERLLGGLGHALRLWPELEPALEQPAPTVVELSAEQAYQFLRDAVPALEQAGYGVLAPPWWRQRLRVKLTAAPEQEWGESTGLFGLDGLCAYEWQVAIGDQTLSLGELEALAELKLPIVKSRGRWIALRGEDVEMALRFFAGRSARGHGSAGELMREALGLVGSGAGDGGAQPEIEIDAAGWLGELLRADGDRRLEGVETPKSFVGELRPYQQRGLAWMAFLSDLGLGACLADDMGLGKTVQLLALLLSERERSEAGTGRGRRSPGPTLLICPVSVTGNWQREAERFAPSLRVHLHYGRERLRGEAFARAAKRSDLMITTYALALRDRETLSALEWGRVALDEAQNIKTRDAKQTRAIRQLRARHRIALTGTPVENRLTELHSIVDFLNPGLLGSVTSFQDRYATPIERWRDGAAAARLRQATGPFILRRLKTDRTIITDLPDKIEMRVDCHLTREQATLYRAVVDEMLERAAGAEGIARAGVVLQALMKLKQVCNHPAHLLKDRSAMDGRSGKLTRLEEILDEALAEGDKALCFTQFAEFGHSLSAHLQDRLGREVLFLHGGTPRSARDRMVERFQSPDGPAVFVLSLKAGGTGLNLTAANHVIHYDRWWNPAVEDQATDRAFRIGQRKHVQVRKLSCVGTLEDRIDQLISEKKELAEQIVGSGEAWLTELDTGQLRDLVALSSDAVMAA
jgi:non-specific serine/threonine protein kinase